MIAFLEGPDLLVVLVVVLLMFGGAKIPQLARSLGQAQKEFQRGLRGEPEPDDQDKDKVKAEDNVADEGAPVVGDGAVHAGGEAQDDKPGTTPGA